MINGLQCSPEQLSQAGPCGGTGHSVTLFETAGKVFKTPFSKSTNLPEKMRACLPPNFLRHGQAILTKENRTSIPITYAPPSSGYQATPDTTIPTAPPAAGPPPPGATSLAQPRTGRIKTKSQSSIHDGAYLCGDLSIHGVYTLTRDLSKALTVRHSPDAQSLETLVNILRLLPYCQSPIPALSRLGVVLVNAILAVNSGSSLYMPTSGREKTGKVIRIFAINSLAVSIDAWSRYLELTPIRATGGSFSSSLKQSNGVPARGEILLNFWDVGSNGTLFPHVSQHGGE